MAKIFSAVFVIFGAVVGSGFSSGKEIWVYFSRFGAISYLFILFASLMFFFLFKFILSNGENLSKKIKSSPWMSLVTVFVSTIFCASMLSGISNLFSYFSSALHVILMFFVLVLCFFVAQKGLKSLEKINLILMPTVAVMFFVILLSFLKEFGSFSTNSNFFGIFYAPLYVALNTSMNTLVISELGKNMTKKQINLTCFVSVGLIFLFLILGNVALSSSSGDLDMPFLSIAQGNSVSFVIMFFIILSGCFTTLISLCYTLCSALIALFKRKKLCVILSVLLPFAISFLGFSEIVTILYPICSALGLAVLFFLLVKR